MVHRLVIVIGLAVLLTSIVAPAPPTPASAAPRPGNQGHVHPPRAEDDNDEREGNDERDPTATPMPRRNDEFLFLRPPTISMETYQSVYCQPRHGRVSDACPYAPQMYQMLIDAGIDPVIELAFAAKETEFGTTGPGRSPQNNIHCVICNDWDGGTCDGVYHTRFASYSSYLHATQAWILLMLTQELYIDAGNMTFREVIPIYAPSFENNTELYISQTESWVRGWRSWDNIQDLPIAPVIWGAGIRQPPPLLGDPRFLNGLRVLDDDRVHTSPLDNPYLPEGAIAVDNSDPGFSSNQATWEFNRCGMNEDHIATLSTSEVKNSTSRASWMTDTLEVGPYEVQVYVPGCGETEPTRSARYAVTHDGGVSTVTVNQHEHVGEWVSLGTYHFGKRLTPLVEISDLTNDDNLAIRVDAIAWLPKSQASLVEPSVVSSGYSGVPLPEAMPTALPPTATPPHRRGAPTPTPTPTPARPVPTPTPRTTPTEAPGATTGGMVGVVIHGGNLRSEPRISASTVIAEVCPGDEVLLLEERERNGHSWNHVRLLATSSDCVDNRASEGDEGWVSNTLIAEPEE